MTSLKHQQRIAVYMRVSTEMQDCAMQQRAIDHWLRETFGGLLRDLPKYDSFTDFGMSGASNLRPQYRKLLRGAKKKKYDCIVVYALDRFSRSASEAIHNLMVFEHIGVDFISVTQPIISTMNNPFKRTMMALFAEIAEIERSILIRRVKDGIAAAQARGVKFGPKPKVTPKIIADIEALREAGHTIRSICKEVGLSQGVVHRVIKKGA